MSSVKHNFAYNLLLTLSGYIFPLITYPYVSRVLGVQNIGVCSFADSIINYFVLFSMLGIGSYGVREIARVRQKEEQRNEVFSNLVVVNLLTTIIAIVVLVICTYTIPKLSDYKPFLLIGVAKILFNMFLIEWFYQGIQDFRYITFRTLFVRIIYVISIFVFVHSADDTLLYFFLTSATTIINAVINWLHSKRFVRFSLRSLKPHLFLIPIITFGYYRILTSMYTTFNTVFLGFASGEIEVGYFATATKLYSIFMAILTAFTTVMVPRVSELVQEGNQEKMQWIANQTFVLVTIISLPVIIVCQFCSADIILLIAGTGFDGAILPFRIVISLLFVIGTEQILIQQFLMASKKNSSILIVSTVGAITGVTLNILFTPNLGSAGSAIAWGVSELSVLSIGALFFYKNLGLKIPFRGILNNMILSFLYIIPLFIIYIFHFDITFNLPVSILTTLFVFIVINVWLNKNEQVVGLVNGFKKYVVK